MTASPYITCRAFPYVAHCGGLHERNRHEGGAWTAAQNLGPTVNTAADEYHPTLTRDGRMLLFVRRVDGDGVLSTSLRAPSTCRRAYIQPVRLRRLRDVIQPKHIVAVHIPPGVADDIKARIRHHFPNADAFTEMLEMHRYD